MIIAILLGTNVAGAPY